MRLSRCETCLVIVYPLTLCKLNLNGTIFFLIAVQCNECITLLFLLFDGLSSFEFNPGYIYRYSIVEGDHSLWKGVSKPYRETIRAFLVYFQSQVTSSC